MKHIITLSSFRKLLCLLDDPLAPRQSPQKQCMLTCMALYADSARGAPSYAPRGDAPSAPSPVGLRGAAAGAAVGGAIAGGGIAAVRALPCIMTMWSCVGIPAVRLEQHATTMCTGIGSYDTAGTGVCAKYHGFTCRTAACR